ncbi:chemotaxis protein CheX [Ilumatobacter sp.]|uniref:chemotaxis protein CheX n=1 Tax=Ilumatobacter sp. TaxID=1967498 RepID=UPI003B51694C
MTDALQRCDPELLDELREVVIEMLDGLADAALAGRSLPDVERLDSMVVESTLAIVGDAMRSELVLRVPAPDAVALAAALGDDDPAGVTIDEACGVVSELCNVIAGSAKTLFDAETSLDVPRSIAIPLDSPRPLGAIDVEHALGHFAVHLGDARPE